MLNQFVLVGRLKEIMEVEGGLLITVATPRPYKNENEEYEVDNIDILVRNGLVQNVKDFCVIGGLIGVKGRLERVNDNPHPAIVGEKITFLSSKKEDEE